MKKVVMADDHQLVLDGLKALLEGNTEFSVVATASNGKELLKVLGTISADLVMTDIDMPVMNGIEAVREIRKRFPEIRILALSMHREPGMIRKMTEAGAHGYVLKNIGKEELTEALSRLAEGKGYFSADVTEALLFKEQNTGSGTVDADLTPREVEILGLIADGFSNTEIGEKLFISPRTVDTHRANIMKKTGCDSIATLVRFAITNQLI